MTLGVLASGALGFEVLQKLVDEKHVVFSMTDSNSVAIRNFCEEKGLPCFVGNPRKKNTAGFLNNKAIDVLISVNYLFIIEKNIIDLPAILAFNVHGSLLPKYRGRTPHVWAIINNEKETGITAHLIDEGCDTGDIIEQIIIPISASDTGEDILIKFHFLYPGLVNKVLNNIESNTISLKKQDHSIATYFGKRTPDDGLINWDWQKERIYNWVRAQAYPYPGAFTYYNNEKVVIDKISFSNCGFDFRIPNGEIISFENGKPIVKVQNGTVMLDIIRNNHIRFNLKERFNG